MTILRRHAGSQTPARDRIGQLVAFRGCPVLTEYSVRAGVTGEIRSLILDDRVLKPASPRRGLAVQDEGAAGSRDHLAAAPAERAAPARSLEPEIGGRRPIGLCLALSPFSVGVERRHDCPTGNRYSMASDGLPTVLALEVALSRRSSKDPRRDSAPDPGDEPGQPAVGCTAHPRRAAQARHR